MVQYFYNTLLRLISHTHIILNFYNYFKNIFFTTSAIQEVRKSLRGAQVFILSNECQLIKIDVVNRFCLLIASVTITIHT